MNRNNALVLCTLLVCLTFGGIPLVRALDNPVSDLSDVELTVPAAATKLTSITPTTGVWAGGYESVYIGNSLATCIRIGGPTLTVTSGFEIGLGCRDGVGVTLDARAGIWVMDDGGGTVAGVDVIKGNR